MIPVVSDPARIAVTVVNTRPEHAAALAELQRVVFPTLDESELFTEAKYLNHIRLFPEGQFVALAQIDGGEPFPIGATSTFRTTFDFDHIQHTYIEAIAGGWLSNHDPHGEWMYGVDVSVHPAYRGLRIGRQLYTARRDAARQLNLRGEIAGALIPHYEQVADRLTIAQYALQVYQGRLHDPTLSMQIRNGFVPRGVLYDHISDPRSWNAAVLIVRENAHYRPVAPAIVAASSTLDYVQNAPHHHHQAHSHDALRRREAAHHATHPPRRTTEMPRISRTQARMLDKPPTHQATSAIAAPAVPTNAVTPPAPATPAVPAPTFRALGKPELKRQFRAGL